MSVVKQVAVRNKKVCVKKCLCGMDLLQGVNERDAKAKRKELLGLPGTLVLPAITLTLSRSKISEAAQAPRKAQK